MNDSQYQQHMLYDHLEDYHEPHDYPPRKTKAKHTYFDLSKPYQEGGSRVSVYHIKAVSTAKDKPLTYESRSVTANSSAEAIEAVMMEMNWQAKIKMCKEVG